MQNGCNSWDREGGQALSEGSFEGERNLCLESLSNEGVFLTKHLVALQDKTSACERNGHP